jgi:uncharacterized protein (TIGR03118 family)
MQSQKHWLLLSIVCLICLLGTVLLAVPAQAKPFAYVTNSSSSSVSVIDTANNTVSATVAVGGRPVAVAFTPNGSRVYVANSNSNSISVIDTATNTVTANVAVQSFPQGLAITPDGSRAYVANTASASVSAINTATNTVTSTVGVGMRPVGVAITPDGSRGYVTNAGSSSVSVIDTATNTVTATVGVGVNPVGVAISPDGSRAYVTNDNTTNPGSVSVIGTATNTVVATIGMFQPVGVAFTPDGTHAYVTNSSATFGSVSVVDTASNTVIATVGIGPNPHGVAITPDGTRAYAPSFGSNSVFVIDTATNTVTATVGVGSAPVGVAISPPPITQRYAQINLVSDIPGMAAFTDKKLKNPWGIAFGPTSPFWIADNGTGLSTLYAKDGTPILQLPSVRIPPPHGSSSTATPTGMVFNPTTDFVVSGDGNSGPAIFLFATEDGTISGWNPTVALRRAVLAVDNSQIGAVYKGLAFGHTFQGNFIYATNFHDGSVEMYDTNFQIVKTFTDIGLPPGYAPFGIRAIRGKLYVTFAKQDADKHDDVPGSGHGFVDVFNFQGHMLQRFVSRNRLNSPWGVALAPANFGGFSGALLVGNFGDGKINAFDPGSGAFLGALRDLQGHILSIDGLWTITFGNGGSTGPRNALFFSAGPNHEADGLFGVLTVIP